MNLKKLSLLLVLAMFAFVSCSDDDDNGTTDKPIVGTWEYHSMEFNVVTNSTENDGKVKTYLEDASDLLTYQRVIFDNRGSAVIHNSAPHALFDQAVGTYSYSNGKVTIKTVYRGDEVTTQHMTLQDGILTEEQDWTETLNNFELDQLLRIGINDPDFHVTKAIVRVNHSKK